MHPPVTVLAMARTGHKKAPRKNPPANEGRKYRLYLTDDVDVVMTSWGHTRRAIYNLALEQRKVAWSYGRKTLRADAQSRDLTEARAEIDWIGDFPAQAGQQVLRQLDAAYDNWWNPAHPASAPAFEKRSGTLRFSLPGQALELRRLNRKWGEVRPPKLGWQRLSMSRPLGGTICNATFTKKAGVWHVSFGVAATREAAPPDGKPGCGVDFGVACSAYLSTEDEPRLMRASLTVHEKQRLLGLERCKARQVTYAKKHNHGRSSTTFQASVDVSSTTSAPGTALCTYP
jgi:putative transposase